jgi:predicted TIM-barrel fold metal-dependent hydrolase
MTDNVYMDITCCGGEGVIERAIKRLGSGEFVWGTDVGNFIGEFFQSLSLQISDDDKMKILWDNPMRIYRL